MPTALAAAVIEPCSAMAASSAIRSCPPSFWPPTVSHTLPCNAIACSSGFIALHEFQVLDVGHATIFHAQHMLAESAHVLGIVGDQYHRNVEAALQRIQLGAHAFAQAGIQRRERLVQQQRRRLRRQRARQRHPLPLATGQLMRELVRHMLQFKRQQPIADRLAIYARQRIAPAALQAEGDVLPHVQVWEQRVILEQIGQLPPLRRQVDALAAVEQAASGHLDAAAVRRHQPGHRLQQQALARARLAVDHDALAARRQLRAQFEGARAGTQGLDDVDIDLHAQACGLRLSVSLFAAISTTMQTTEVMITSRLALSSCPACTASYTAIDSVCVLPGMLPATISVAPNSPIARANASKAPASTPRQASGRVTRKNTPIGAMPSTRAACSNCRSTVSNAVRADFNISGSDTTAAAITAACHVKIRLMPKTRNSHAPSQPLWPRTTSR